MTPVKELLDLFRKDRGFLHDHGEVYANGVYTSTAHNTRFPMIAWRVRCPKVHSALGQAEERPGPYLLRPEAGEPVGIEGAAVGSEVPVAQDPNRRPAEPLPGLEVVRVPDLHLSPFVTEALVGRRGLEAGPGRLVAFGRSRSGRTSRIPTSCHCSTRVKPTASLLRHALRRGGVTSETAGARGQARPVQKPYV